MKFFTDLAWHFPATLKANADNITTEHYRALAFAGYALQQPLYRTALTRVRCYSDEVRDAIPPVLIQLGFNGEHLYHAIQDMIKLFQFTFIALQNDN